MLNRLPLTVSGHDTVILTQVVSESFRVYNQNQMWLWDYDLPKKWQPKAPRQWEWFLVRKINYGDFKGLKKETVKKFLPRIKERLDPGKRVMLENFFNHEYSN